MTAKGVFVLAPTVEDYQLMGFPIAYHGPKEISYLFIDGACFEKTIVDYSNKFFGGERMQICFTNLRSSFEKVFYYDCLPVKKDSDSEECFNAVLEEKQKLFDQLSEMDGFHVLQGTMRAGKRERRQKEIDVLIAVQMLQHSFRRNMHRATLFASDLDFRPLIEALVQDGMYVSLWYPIDHTSQDLTRSADERIPFTLPASHRLCTGEFLRRFPIPKQEVSRDAAASATPKAPWKLKNGTHANVFQDDEGEWTIVVPHQQKSKYWHLSSKNSELLRGYAEHHEYGL